MIAVAVQGSLILAVVGLTVFVAHREDAIAYCKELWDIARHG